MSVKLYIEARTEENWDDMTHLFCDYLQKYENIEGFGIVKLESIRADNVPGRLMGFSVKDGFSACTEHFEQWASSLGRVYGHTASEQLPLSNGDVLTV